MPNVNRVHIEGHLGAKPELRYTNQQKPVCSASVATTKKTKDSQGQWVDGETTWHRIVVWGDEAKKLAQFDTGDIIRVWDGELKTRKWEDKDGNTRYTTEINAYRFHGEKKQTKEEYNADAPASTALPEGMEDIPF